MFFTGHGLFNRHVSQMKLVLTSRYRKCGDIEETAEHLLCECDALSHKHYRSFGRRGMEPIDFLEVDLKKILNLIKYINIITEV